MGMKHIMSQVFGMKKKLDNGDYDNGLYDMYPDIGMLWLSVFQEAFKVEQSYNSKIIDMMGEATYNTIRKNYEEQGLL